MYPHLLRPRPPLRQLLLVLGLMLALQACSDAQKPSESVEQSVSDTLALDSSTLPQVSEISLPVPDTIDTIPACTFDYPRGGYNPADTGETVMEFEGFILRIDSKFLVNDSGPYSDTLLLMEDVGQYIAGKKITLEPSYDRDRFTVYLSAEENIWEQYDYQAIAAGTETLDEYKANLRQWERNRASWSGSSDFELVLPNSAGIYCLPSLKGPQGYFERKREELFSLRDTLVDGGGEGDNFATIIYQEKVCHHFVNDLVVKIVRTKPSGEKSREVFKISLSYGC